MKNIRAKDSMLDDRKVSIIEAIVTYCLTIMAINDKGSKDILDDVNSILSAIDSDQGVITENDLNNIIECLNLSKDKFKSRMII